MSYEQILHAPESGSSKLIFLHHVDEFEANAIKKCLMEENIKIRCLKYEIFGCLNHQENLIKVMHGRHPLEIFNSSNENFVTKVMNCDVMVFNANSTNFDKVCIDLRRVMQGLEMLSKEQNESSSDARSRKLLILISTPMTWALTTPDVTTTEDDEVTNEFLLENDYRRRKAHKNYCKHKLLERDVIWFQKKCQYFIKTLVVCPGITYGGENEKFHYIFKHAFYNQPVPILSPGRQLIPMIYLKDFVRIMKSIFDNYPESKVRYVFAVQPILMSLKSFVYKICKSFNDDCSKIRYQQNIDLLMMDKELFPQSLLDVLSVNLQLMPTYFKDFEFTTLNDEFWHLLAQEFREARNLKPLKIVVDGPPLVGKTEHAKKLAEFYQVIYIDTSQVISTYISFLEEKITDSTIAKEHLECNLLKGKELREKEDKRSTLKTIEYDQEDKFFIEELQSKIEVWSDELFQLKVYIASHKNFEDQDFEMLSKCLIALISDKQYNVNQGYVIDGFPFSYNQANKIFYTTDIQNESNIEANKDMIRPPILKPTHVVIFDATDEQLCKHAMSLTEIEATIRRCLRHQMLPRLDAYRERNEGPDCLANLFYDNELVPISIVLEQDTKIEDTLRIIKNEIGSPFTYPLSSAQQKALNDIAIEKRQKEREQQKLRKAELLKSMTMERDRKLAEWTEKYNEIMKHEHEMHEIKTLPLRQYLEKYVLPTLTEGILKVAELQPDDPVDFLAEYLFKSNPEGQQVPPFCTDEQRSRFMNSFYEDLNSGSNYVSSSVRFGCDECHGDKKF